MNVLALLVVVILFCVIYWAIQEVTTAFGVSPKIKTLLTVALVLVFALWLLGALGLTTSGPILRLR